MDGLCLKRHVAAASSYNACTMVRLFPPSGWGSSHVPKLLFLKGSMYSYMIYFGLKVVSIVVLEGTSS